MGLRRANHVAWRRVGEETVLIHLKNKKIFVLNPSGGFFWHALDGTRGARELLETLKLDDPIPETAPGRLETFFTDLEGADLVESNGDSAPGAPASKATEYPSARFEPPELVWQEEIRNFGQSCAFNPAGGPPCDSAPTT